jgi:hypothetical protein
MTRKDSVLYCTGQAWKFWAMCIAMLISAVFGIWAFWVKDSFSAGWFPLMVLVECLLCFGSLAFGWAAIKCPVCSARWIWLAVSKKHKSDWFGWLFAQYACPVCGTSCRKFTANREVDG